LKVPQNFSEFADSTEEEPSSQRKDYFIAGIKMNILDIKHIEHHNTASIPQTPMEEVTNNKKIMKRSPTKRV